MIFLLQEVIGAMDTAHVETKGMISGQGASCFSYCKVKLNWRISASHLHNLY